MSHNRSMEVLGPNFRWSAQTPDNVCEIFCRCLNTFEQLQAAWEAWRGKPENNVMDWHPGMYLPGSEHKRIYDAYFPAIVNRASDGRKFVSYNSNRVTSAPREWLNLPPLDFLPLEVDDVIAGAGGLLCVNGGSQPRHPNPGTPPVPGTVEPDAEYNLGLYPEQSILVVCNPATREIRFMPRHTRFDMTNKTACMALVAGERRKASSTTKRVPYRLYVLGGHVVKSLTAFPGSSEVAILTYDSRADTWIAGTSAENARLPAHGRTDLARVGDGFLFGGQVTSGRTVRREGGALEHTWENKIFWVQGSLSKWNALPFVVFDRGDEEGPRPRRSVCCQAPRVVQCHPDGGVYAVTRQVRRPVTIKVFEVEIVNKVPTGHVKFVTAMPPAIYYSLFEKTASHKAYDCTAGSHYVAFLVEHANQHAVAIFDLVAGEWFLSSRPIERGRLGRYALARCEWTPQFAAKP